MKSFVRRNIGIFMKIMIGCVKPFQKLQQQIAAYLSDCGHEVIFVKTDQNITAIAHEVGRNVSEKIVDRAIIIDDFAQLPFMITTKYPHTMVAPIFNEYSAELTIEHNNTNIICLGAALISPILTLELVKIYFNSNFDGGRHLVRTDMIASMIKGEC